MEIRGKLLGGVAGLALFAFSGLPLGALIGFLIGSLLGHHWFDVPREDKRGLDAEYREHQRKQRRFLSHVFTLCAKVAKSDGPINRQEINHMERLMSEQFRLNARGREHAIKIWKHAKESSDSFDQYVKAFYQEFGAERYRVNDMLDLLFAMCAADGGLHPKEEEMLRRAAGGFHISPMQYENLKKRYYRTPPEKLQKWSSLDPHYAILGANAGDSLEVLKKKYRELAKMWHPDAVAAKGLSAEAQRHAKEKFQQINEAYEQILEHRKA